LPPILVMVPFPWQTRSSSWPRTRCAREAAKLTAADTPARVSVTGTENGPRRLRSEARRTGTADEGRQGGTKVVSQEGYRPKNLAADPKANREPRHHYHSVFGRRGGGTPRRPPTWPAIPL